MSACCWRPRPLAGRVKPAGTQDVRNSVISVTCASDPSGARQLSRVERCVSLCAQQWILLLPWRRQDDKDEEEQFEMLL